VGTHVHVYPHENRSDPKLDEILISIADLRSVLMASVAEFQAALDKIDAETTRIGTVIQDLLAQLTRTDLDAAAEADILSKINQAAERLKSVGTSVENPVPPTDPGEVPV
jgi:hypothetical protein